MKGGELIVMKTLVPAAGAEQKQLSVKPPVCDQGREQKLDAAERRPVSRNCFSLAHKRFGNITGVEMKAAGTQPAAADIKVPGSRTNQDPLFFSLYIKAPTSQIHKQQR